MFTIAFFFAVASIEETNFIGTVYSIPNLIRFSFSLFADEDWQNDKAGRNQQNEQGNLH